MQQFLKQTAVQFDAEVQRRMLIVAIDKFRQTHDLETDSAQLFIKPKYSTSERTDRVQHGYRQFLPADVLLRWKAVTRAVHKDPNGPFFRKNSQNSNKDLGKVETILEKEVQKIGLDPELLRKDLSPAAQLSIDEARAFLGAPLDAETVAETLAAMQAGQW